MRLYNSLTRKKEVFAPAKENRVNLFVCGPTVYDYSHVGHARTYLVYDALVKYMRRRLGWNIFYIQNITDIDDKIIARSRERGQDPLALAKEFERSYYKDMTALGIDAVDAYAPATDYIPEIISQVERLLANKHAYIIDDDGVYFDVTTFKNYGALSGRTAEAAEDAVSRIDESVNKKSRADFALWKFSKPGEPVWQAPFGAGRPGWHIEDTAIAEKRFGFQYDMHGGAIELIFPHHEAEIAQMESLSGRSPMVRHWVHTGLLTTRGKKMSKSLGNSLTIGEFLAKESAETIRMFVFSSLYRSPVDYSEETIGEARARLGRLFEFRAKISRVGGKNGVFPSSDLIEGFWQALEDDFNTPEALARLFGLVAQANKAVDEHKFSQKDAQAFARFFDELNGILGILPPPETAIPEEIKNLTEEREKLRLSGQFDQADEIRQRIEKSGYEISDTESGPLIRQK